MKPRFRVKVIQFGRTRRIDRDKIRKLYINGTGATAIANEEGIGRSTVYKLFKEVGIKSAKLTSEAVEDTLHNELSSTIST